MLKVRPGFFSLLIVKCERKKDKLREELLNKKKIRLDDLGILQLIQSAKDVILGDSLLGKSAVQRERSRIKALPLSTSPW